MLPLLHASDQARLVGPDGRENLALATAFEIGRLLALAEPSVVAALLIWRKDALDDSRRRALLGREPFLGGLGIRTCSPASAPGPATSSSAGSAPTAPPCSARPGRRSIPAPRSTASTTSATTSAST